MDGSKAATQVGGGLDFKGLKMVIIENQALGPLHVDPMIYFWMIFLMEGIQKLITESIFFTTYNPFKNGAFKLDLYYIIFTAFDYCTRFT